MALLIIYGLMAGMLSLGRSPDAEPINVEDFDKIKYFIGFISALAGLFSEQAFEKLNEISKTLFGQKDAAEGRNKDDSKTKESDGTRTEQNGDKEKIENESQFEKSDEDINETGNKEDQKAIPANG